MNILCWWFGCDPDYSAHGAIPCLRCGAHDTSYEDRCGYTPHNRLKGWLYFWLYRRWWPTRCLDCGKRYGNHYDCIPF